MMGKAVKRTVSLVLMVALLASAVPAQAFAAGERAAFSYTTGVETAAAVTLDYETEPETGEESPTEPMAENAPSPEAQAPGADEGLAEINATSIKYGSVSGKTVAAGAPLAGVSVRLYSVKEETFYYVTSDADGLWESPEYEFIAGYEYVVNYYKAGYAFAENDVTCTATEEGTTLADAEAASLGIEAVTNLDDYTFSAQGDGYYISKYTGTDENILLPAEYEGKPVTGISAYVFQKNTTLQTVYFSEQITEVGNYAFESATALTDVYFPNTLTTIGYDAFEKCEKLTSPEFPFGLKSIGSYAFRYCAAMTAADLPDSVESIGPYAFAATGIASFRYPLKWSSAGTGIFGACEKLTEVTVPEGITTIPKEAFYGANYLEKINLPSTLTTIDREAFYNCAALKDVDFPDGLTTIDYAAFRGCEAFTKLDLPDSVTYIGQNAFAACTGVESFHYPLKLTGSGDSVFSGCTSLTSVTVPEGITTIPQGFFERASLVTVDLPSTLKTIGDYAFSYCADLQNPVFPDGLEIIGNDTFEDCTSITRLELPDSVTAIRSWAFGGCTSLEYFRYPKSLADVGQAIWGGENKIKKIDVPEGVTVIPKWTFSGLTSLKSVTLPTTLTEIGDEAFYGCSGIKIIDFPDALEKIGTEAFRNCTSLITAELPDGVITIGNYAFRGCTALEYFKYPLKLESANGILQACPNITGVEVPEGVKTLPNGIFQAMADLESVSLPSTLKTIDSYAFKDCTALTGIDLPDGLETVGGEAFYGCTGLTELVLPDSVTSIGYRAFMDCKNLLYINYPQNLEDGNSNIFTGCEKLTSITVPEGVTKVPDFMFYGAPFKTIYLPSTITEVGRQAFEFCSNLKFINLPVTVTKIGKEAFYGCANLDYVTIPAMKCSIAYDAFSNCKAVIRCKENSDAMLYAFQYGMDFELIAFDEGDLERLALDMDNSALYATGDTAIVTDYVPMTLKYKLNDDVSPTDMTLTVSFTANTYLNERGGAVTLDGRTVENYTYAKTSSGDTLTVPVTEREGVLRFSVMPYETGTIAAYGSFICKLNGTDSQDVIGLVYLTVPVLTLDLPQFTSEKTFTANGMTAGGAQLVFKVGDTEVGSAAAKKDGTYSARLTLPGTPEDGKTYTVTASLKDDETVTTSAVITYNEAAPRATRFDMYYLSTPSKYVDLLAVDGSRYTFSFAPGSPFKFVIQFENYDKLGDVIVTSTRSGVTSKIKAEPTETPGEYIAEGYFTSPGELYLPGTIELKYTTVVELEDVKTNLTRDDLNDYWKNSTFAEESDEEGNLSGKIVFEDGDFLEISVKDYTAEELYAEYFGTSSPQFQRRIDNGSVASVNGVGADIFSEILSDFVQEYGSSVITNGVDVAVLHNEQNRSFDYIYIDPIADTIGKTCVKYGSAAGIVKGVGAAPKYLSDAATGTGVILGEIEAGIHCGQNIVNIHKARDSINNSNMSAAQKEQYHQRVTELAWGYTALNTIRFAAPVAGAAIGAAVGGPLGMIVGLLFGAIVGIATEFIEAGLDDCLEYYSSGRGVSMRPIIDPSGIVYDARSETPLEGVTVTAYWIEYDEENADFWTSVPDAAEYGTVWDAVEYSQINPIVTDETGIYAWEVPEGWWRVKYEKDGYETVWSDWMSVPPERKDVNVALVSLSSESYVLTKAGEGESSVTVGISKTEGEEETVQYVIAAYDELGRMLEYVSDTVSITEGEVTEVVFDYSLIEQINYIKAFLLGVKNVDPLCEAWYYKIST